jgi:hypothetical protein
LNAECDKKRVRGRGRRLRVLRGDRKKVYDAKIVATLNTKRLLPVIARALLMHIKPIS